MKKVVSVSLFTLISLLLCLPICHSQDLTGNWYGTIKKHSNAKPFYHQWTIEQKGIKVEAVSFIQYTDEEWYCRKKTTGQVSGGHVIFRDYEMIKDHHDRGAYWLWLNGKLRYDDKEDKLYGWVNAYDPTVGALYEKHDYVELWRKKVKYVNYQNSENEQNDFCFPYAIDTNGSVYPTLANQE